MKGNIPFLMLEIRVRIAKGWDVSVVFIPVWKNNKVNVEAPLSTFGDAIFPFPWLVSASFLSAGKLPKRQMFRRTPAWKRRRPSGEKTIKHTNETAGTSTGRKKTQNKSQRPRHRQRSSGLISYLDPNGSLKHFLCFIWAKDKTEHEVFMLIMKL